MIAHAELSAILGRPPASLRVWLVHDWLTGMRGGEKVLLQLVRLFPKAKIATLFHTPKSVDPEIESRVRATSFLQRVAHIESIYRRLLPIMPEAIRSIALDRCDLVISTSHCVAKGVAVPRGVGHLCYCFTPMRYVWETSDLYFAHDRGLTSRVAALAAGPLRDLDLKLNEGVTCFATTCRNVAARIARCYGRQATVVYPGIDPIYLESPPAAVPAAANAPYLIVSALVGYKRVDLAVQTFAADPSRKLLIIGKGPDEKKLKALAGNALNKTITFAGWQDEPALREAYTHCRALLFPGEEDFGLVPLEAQACGRPVIACGAGGVLETVQPLGHARHPTGIFFPDQTLSALAAAIREFEHHESRFDAAQLRAHAAHFTWRAFDKGICTLAADLL